MQASSLVGGRQEIADVHFVSSDYGGFFVCFTCLFLPFSLAYKILLKVKHDVFDNRSTEK